MNQDYNQLLQKAWEQSLTPAEAAALKAELNRNPTLRQQWEDQQALQPLLAQQQLRLPPFLATRVQQRLAQETLPIGQSLTRAFRLVALPVLAAMLGLLVLTYAREEQVTLEILSGTADLQMEQSLMLSLEAATPAIVD